MKKRWRLKFITIIASLALVVSMMPMIPGLSGAAEISYADDDTRQKITEMEFELTDYTPKYGDVVDGNSFTPDEYYNFATVGSPAYVAKNNGLWYKKDGNSWKFVSSYDNVFEEGIYQVHLHVSVSDPDANGNSGATHVLADGYTVKVNGVPWIANNVIDKGTYSYTSIYSPEFVVTRPEGLPLSLLKEKLTMSGPLFTDTPIDSFSLKGNVYGGNEANITYTKTSGPEWIQVSEDGLLTGTPTTVADKADCIVSVTDGDETKSITIEIPKVSLNSASKTKIDKLEFTLTDYTPKYGDVIDGNYFTPDEYYNFATVGSPAYVAKNNGLWYKKDGNSWKFVSNYDNVFEEGTYQIGLHVSVSDPDAYGNSSATHVLANEYTVKVNGVPWTATNVFDKGEYSYTTIYSPEFVVEKTPPAKVSKVTLSTTSYTYNGSVKSPSVTVQDSNGETLKNGTDYTVTTPSGRKNVGTYTYKITMKGDYSGTFSRSFVINPKGATIKTPTKAKKAFTAKWSKQTSKMSSSRITGYQVQYSTNKSFSGAKTVSVKGYTKASKKISKLKAKTTYYVKVRTYMNVSGKTYYSSWSKVKSVKTK